MKRLQSGCVVVWVTAPDLRTARKLARLALEARLAACAQLRSGIESHYWWRGKYETSREVLITFKTHSRHLPALDRLVVDNHPYDTPQFVVSPITGGNRRYLDWIDAETSTSAKPC